MSNFCTDQEISCGKFRLWRNVVRKKYWNAAKFTSDWVERLSRASSRGKVPPANSSVVCGIDPQNCFLLAWSQSEIVTHIWHKLEFYYNRIDLECLHDIHPSCIVAWRWPRQSVATPRPFSISACRRPFLRKKVRLWNDPEENVVCGHLLCSNCR